MAPIVNANIMLGQTGKTKNSWFFQISKFLFKLKTIKKVFDFNRNDFLFF